MWTSHRVGRAPDGYSSLPWLFEEDKVVALGRSSSTFGWLLAADRRNSQAFDQLLDVVFSRSIRLKPAKVEVGKSSTRDVGGKLLEHQFGIRARQTDEEVEDNLV